MLLHGMVGLMLNFLLIDLCPRSRSLSLSLCPRYDASLNFIIIIEHDFRLNALTLAIGKLLSLNFDGSHCERVKGDDDDNMHKYEIENN